MDGTLYTIAAGHITRRLIPTGGITLLADKVSRANLNLVALPGTEDSDWEQYSLACVAEIAEVLTPWATWHCNPDAVDRTTITPNVWGMSYGARNMIWIRTTRHPDACIPNALHEAYHSLEHYLTGSEIKVLRKASLSGPEMPQPSDYNAYWCSGDEVRARAFAAWAYSHWLMGSIPTYRRRMPAHERIWTMCLRGDLGVRVALRGHIPTSRMPDSLRRRLAQRSDSRKLVDAVVYAARTAWEWCADAFRPEPAAAAGKVAVKGLAA